MSKMERGGMTEEKAGAHRPSGSPVVVLLGVVAVAAMILGLVIGFLIGLMV
ncbi:MAG: hypothetical protein ACK4NA_01725 [Alphaproteobacteria bacterium]